MNRKEKVTSIKKSVFEVNASPGFTVPSMIAVRDFARERETEIRLLQKELDAAKYAGTRRVFQQLPRHMRRRAASYNIKRLPRRLRQRALEEMRNDPPKAPSNQHVKNCRRWRRRQHAASDKLAKPGWLETHIWHAKRCKMIDYWGVRVAAHLNEKCLRSTFRAQRDGALLHDESYWHPYAITGGQGDVIVQLQQRLPTLDASITQAVLMHEGVQQCPIRIIQDVLCSPVLLLHPAAISTGILAHPALVSLLNDLAITLTPIDMCVFSLHGRQASTVLASLTGRANHPTDSVARLLISDPRTGASPATDADANHLHQHLLDPAPIPSSQSITQQRSGLLLPEAHSATPPLVPIATCPTSATSLLLLCPKKWARVLWHRLVRIKPVKVAGITQMERIALERQQPRFPQDFVGSPAYAVWSEAERQRAQSQHDRLPPAKRPAYAKLGVTSPFKTQFDALAPARDLRRCFLQVEGRGVIAERTPLLNQQRVIVGHVTTAAASSLGKGTSIAIGFVSRHLLDDHQSTILFHHPASPDTLRQARITLLQ